MKPTEAAKSPATTELEHFEVCVAECLLAVRVCTVEASRSKSCREPFRGKSGENLGQTRVQ